MSLEKRKAAEVKRKKNYFTTICIRGIQWKIKRSLTQTKYDSGQIQKILSNKDTMWSPFQAAVFLKCPNDEYNLKLKIELSQLARSSTRHRIS